ncbi:type 1 glutamine amidotransferase [Streptomyces sp. ACA25]|uniref:type 1 glutamine amidotransferase n=1 Tax=Streptomyces sp. ACA25 TaxID=3022596 RepID=UPI0023077E61|nr:type 1 glutamine amidotransferase [Streptomyces sp. ACA25]MDB1089169.1 type 1 glutamine amidotransferase [Streptomyces sp. ACA25]
MEDAVGARILVVQNTPEGGPQRFGEWLTDAGAALEVVHGYAGAAVPSRPRHDAVVVLGGGFMPDDEVRAPWLKPTRALVGEAVGRGIPVFGICLGGQLLAQVAGGTVTADAGAPELGSVPLTLRAEAGNDPLFHGLPRSVPAVQRHVDAVTALPPGAHWLARSARCPYQAFRVGSRAWGVQFHPEVPADRLRHWDAESVRRHGFDPEELHRGAMAAEPAAVRAWRTVARRFARLADGG